jgi:hypothetical protein
MKVSVLTFPLTILLVAMTFSPCPAFCGGGSEGGESSGTIEYSKRYDSKRVKADSSELHGTVVTSFFDERIAPDRNCVFTCSFNLAWNRLTELLKGDRVQVQPPTPLADYLNKREFTKSVMSESAWLADAVVVKPGTADKAISEINDRLRTKFKDPLLLEADVPSSDLIEIIAWAYFEKNLEFPAPFEGAYSLVFHGAGRNDEVIAFGFSGKTGNSGRGSITYVGQNASEFIVSLDTRDPDDELILALVEPRDTLRATYDKITELVSLKNELPLSAADELMVPKINVQLRHDYQELLGKIIMQDGAIIMQARTTLQFVLDEFGARVKSLSSVTGVKSAAPAPLRLVFDRPFMIIMKERRSPLPYFAVWVGNAELLSPF